MTLEQTIATNFSTFTPEDIQKIITDIRKQFPDYVGEKIIEKVVSQQNIIKQFIAQLAEETSIETKDLRESLSSSLIENIPESSNKIAKIIEELNQELNDFHEFINNKKEQLLTQIYAQTSPRQFNPQQNEDYEAFRKQLLLDIEKAREKTLPNQKSEILSSLEIDLQIINILEKSLGTDVITSSSSAPFIDNYLRLFEEYQQVDDNKLYQSFEEEVQEIRTPKTPNFSLNSILSYLYNQAISDVVDDSKNLAKITTKIISGKADKIKSKEVAQALKFMAEAGIFASEIYQTYSPNPNQKSQDLQTTSDSLILESRIAHKPQQQTNRNRFLEKRLDEKPHIRELPASIPYDDEATILKHRAEIESINREIREIANELKGQDPNSLPKFSDILSKLEEKGIIGKDKFFPHLMVRWEVTPKIEDQETDIRKIIYGLDLSGLEIDNASLKKLIDNEYYINFVDINLSKSKIQDILDVGILSGNISNSVFDSLRGVELGDGYNIVKTIRPFRDTVQSRAISQDGLSVKDEYAQYFRDFTKFEEYLKTLKINCFQSHFKGDLKRLTIDAESLLNDDSIDFSSAIFIHPNIYGTLKADLSSVPVSFQSLKNQEYYRSSGIVKLDLADETMKMVVNPYILKESFDELQSGKDIYYKVQFNKGTDELSLDKYVEATPEIQEKFSSQNYFRSLNHLTSPYGIYFIGANEEIPSGTTAKNININLYYDPQDPEAFLAYCDDLGTIPNNSSISFFNNLLKSSDEILTGFLIHEIGHCIFSFIHAQKTSASSIMPYVEAQLFRNGKAIHLGVQNTLGIDDEKAIIDIIRKTRGENYQTKTPTKSETHNYYSLEETTKALEDLNPDHPKCIITTLSGDKTDLIINPNIAFQDQQKLVFLRANDALKVCFSGSRSIADCSADPSPSLENVGAIAYLDKNNNPLTVFLTRPNSKVFLQNSDGNKIQIPLDLPEAGTEINLQERINQALNPSQSQSSTFTNDNPQSKSSDLTTSALIFENTAGFISLDNTNTTEIISTLNPTSTPTQDQQTSEKATSSISNSESAGNNHLGSTNTNSSQNNSNGNVAFIESPLGIVTIIGGISIAVVAAVATKKIIQHLSRDNNNITLPIAPEILSFAEIVLDNGTQLQNFPNPQPSEALANQVAENQVQNNYQV